MANPSPANRTSENILKEGFLRYKHTSVALARLIVQWEALRQVLINTLQEWRLRYVVFKVISSRRLQFMVYKEHPPSPSNEIKEIPIEEFGGIESNLKLDNEKNAFAIISTNFTDCFSAETPEEMQEWVRVLQWYLGKELVLNITIPHKQNMLKIGKAQLRIRNNSFTISTCDNPPRCQGTWQIIHIRKFGGTDTFRFQTGSKCPTGEYLYTISTDDNSRVKALFSDLSQHKPIFTDDFVGKHMTLERSRLEKRTTSPTPHPDFTSSKRNPLSLQTREAPAHLHKNWPRYINQDHFRYNIADPIMQLPSGRRHSANQDQIYNPFTRPIPRQPLRNSFSRSFEDLRDREYQSVYGTLTHGRHSPLKRNQLASSQVATAVDEQIPEGYCNVSLSRVLGRYHNYSISPPSNIADPVMQLPNGRRHSANQDQIYNPFTRPIPRQPLRKGFSRSFEDLRHRPYQNVYGTLTNGRHSPLKRNQLASSQVATAVDEQIPEGYCNVSLSRVLGRYHNYSVSPPSNIADPVMQLPNGRRHSANQDQIYNPFTRPIPRQPLRNSFSRSFEDLQDREYQNVYGTLTHGRHSPLKRNQLASSQVATAVDEQIPEGYCNVSLSHLLGRASSASFFPSADSTPASEHGSRSDTDWPPHKYANIEFDLESAQRRPKKFPSTPASEHSSRSDTDWPPHKYANIEFALESVRPMHRAVSPPKTFPQHNESSLKPSTPARRGHSEHSRKISAPSSSSDPHSPHLMATLSPMRLRSSHSHCTISDSRRKPLPLQDFPVEERTQSQ